MSEFKEVQFRLQPEIRFQDGAIPDASPLVGAKPGDTRELEAKLGSAVVDTDACAERQRPCGSGSTI